MSRLLDEALDLDPADRQLWVDALSPDDSDLKPGLIRALFGDHSGKALGLDTLPKVGCGDPGHAAGELKVGQCVGPYELLRQLGKGGMAQVWLAHRADGVLKRDIALKIPTLDTSQRGLAERFDRERDILAALEHPDIARLYDAGVTPEGVPFLAMEFVPGKPVTAWCDAHRLPIRERISLFLHVLGAVQYAHDKGVLHRDLKPSNILVTDTGQVRLLDFGVAQMLEQPDRALTRNYGKALTPDYASPEQWLDEELGPASDIYSLGVLLYELLVGRPPYRIQRWEYGRAPPAPRLPSTQVDADAADNRSATASRIRRMLQGDLDAIILKAMARTPAARYRTASALGRDLKHYAAGEAILARPHSAWYVAGKFARRHLLAVTTGFVVSLVIAGMGYALLHLGTRPAPASAGVTEEKSIAVLPFTDLSEKRDQEYFSDGLSEELIDRLAQSRQLRVIARTSSFYFKGRTATVGEIARTLNVSHILEGSVRRSGKTVRITAQLIRTTDSTHVWSQTFERSFADIFRLQEEIAAMVAKALDAALTTVPPDSQYQPRIDAYNVALQGYFYYDRSNKGDTDKAIDEFKKAIQADPNYSLAWAGLGLVYIWQGLTNEISPLRARALARKALDQALVLDPRSVRAHRHLGILLRDFDWDFDASRAEFKKAVELDPNGNEGRHAQLEMAAIDLQKTGQYEEFVQLVHEEMKFNPVDTDNLFSLGLAYMRWGRLEDSIAAFRELLELNAGFAGASAYLAQALLLAGRNDEALAAAQRESDEQSRLQVLSCVYWAMGRRQDSDAALNDVVRRYAQTSAFGIANAYGYREQKDVALQWLERAYRQHDPDTISLKVSPFLRGLHDAPQFVALTRKLGLAG